MNKFEQIVEDTCNAGPPMRGHRVTNWAPRGNMNHFILLTALYPSVEEGLKTNIITYRIRADRIDWVAECTPQHGLRHSVVSVGGKEMHVMEPVGEILQHIEDYTLPYKAEYKMHSTSSDKFRQEHKDNIIECSLTQDRLPY